LLERHKKEEKKDLKEKGDIRIPQEVFFGNVLRVDGLKSAGFSDII
jgi:translation elongation factor EF-4